MSTPKRPMDFSGWNFTPNEGGSVAPITGVQSIGFDDTTVTLASLDPFVLRSDLAGVKLPETPPEPDAPRVDPA